MGKAGFNEPDDIRQYDNDPRSPYYVPPPVQCVACNEHYDGDEAWESTDGTFHCSEDCMINHEKEEIK